MKIKKLIRNIPDICLKGPKDIEISGVTENSTLVFPGSLFICKNSSQPKGAHYIAEAISAGAVAIATDIYHPIYKNVTQIIHPHIDQIAGLLANHYYGLPSQELFTVGITGTNGKTTTAFLVKHLLDALQSQCGLIGTIEYIIGSHRYRATKTTPEICLNQKMLREMVLQGCQAAVMEVSSHALEQNRVSSIDYDVGIFTNLTPEHLDYHGDMQTYSEAKKKLFDLLLNSCAKKIHAFSKVAILNSDCPWHRHMINYCAHITYGIDTKADLQATDIQLTPSGTHFYIKYKHKKYRCYFPLVGKYNIYNFLAALAVGLHRQEPMEKLISILENAPQVPGRLQPVPNELGLSVFVDFAHSADALWNVLTSLQQLKTKRVITVFGCGGDRDKEKRPQMAKVVEQLSDYVFVTSDNPRSEDPQVICDEIVKGFTKADSFSVELDRKRAIFKAIEYAAAGDIILIAGKGHENSQIFKHQTIEFNDYTVATSLCRSFANTAKCI